MGKILLRCAFGVSLVLSPLVLVAQQGGSDMGQNNGSSMHRQTVTATGCLQKGQEHGGYYLKDENGKDWELTGSNLASHVGHKITVSGHELKGSDTHETKVESSEKAESGGDNYADLHVTHLKMISENCQQ
jgi:hypothetical protein